MTDALTIDQVLERLRASVERVGSQRAWARKSNVSEAYLSDVLLRRREPGPAILEPLGVHAETIYLLTKMAPREMRRLNAFTKG
jgi:hypothetical protein